ncbi:MAG: hypothetical protein JW996_02015 [Candidatus Cloacimonetes bacterium]|nr:hypothetical protein [Candidatus Cloacimonadota bacterium]
MIFLKAVSIILFNLLIGYTIVLSIRAFLFFPRHRKYIGGKPLPLTPGLVYRGKEKLISKLQGTLDNYLNNCKSSSPDTQIAIWEDRVYQNCWDRLEFLEGMFFLTQGMKSRLRHFFSQIGLEIARQFLRTFIPYLMEHFKLASYIELLDNKLDLKVISGYYNQYIHRFLLIFFLSLNFLIGLVNMSWYLIIK